MKKGFLYMTLGMLLFTAACSKDDKVEEETEYKLEGKYYNGDDLVIEFTGNQAVVIEMDGNKLGTNPAVFSVGQPYIKDISSIGLNKWSGNLIKSKYRFDMTVFEDVLDSISYRPVEITKNNRMDFSMSEYDGMEVIWKVYDGNGSGGNGNTGGSGGSGACIEGTWYSSACGDSKGVVWKFGSNGKGSFSNKDCNGICNPIVFSFSYTINGKTCSIKYDAKQAVVKCSGYPDTAPPKPKDESFTFTCDATKLTVTSGNGTNTFTK